MSLAFFIKLSVGLIALVIVAFVVSLFILFTQLSRYKNYWNEHNQQQIDKTKRLYVALGDSTAQGIGATHPQKGYPALVAKGLESDGKQVQLINLSKSGAKVNNALTEQLPELKKLPLTDDTVITIEIGANDMINFDRLEFEKQMDELMAQLPKQTLISDIPYFGGSRFKSKQKSVIEANEIMYRLAAKHRFELVPLHDRIKENSGLDTFAVDWFHPSNKAYRVNWAHVFLERLK